MARVEYEDRGFWEKKWTAEEKMEKKTRQEESWREGVDVEDYFDRIVLKEARGRNVLDIGCGRGEFTLSVAAVATKVAGVDFSMNAISRATNVELRLANAQSIPYPDESFDLVYCRRGPATYDLKTARETHRILKHDRQFIEEEIGEERPSSTGNRPLEEAKTTHSKNPCRQRRGNCSREQASIRRESRSSKPLSSKGPSRT